MELENQFTKSQYIAGIIISMLILSDLFTKTIAGGFVIVIFSMMYIFGSKIFSAFTGKEKTDLKMWIIILSIGIAELLIMIPVMISLGKNESELSRTNAEAIILSLEKYHDRNKKYPDSLAHLVPEFIEKLPKFKYGNKDLDFSYELTENKEYRFHYATGFKIYWRYNSNDKEWRRDD